MTNQILSTYSLEELQGVIRECIKTELQSSSLNPLNQMDDLITENEAREFLSVSKVTLKKWRDENRIKFYRIGTRIRYKKSEILNPEIRKSIRAKK